MNDRIGAFSILAWAGVLSVLVSVSAFAQFVTNLENQRSPLTQIMGLLNQYRRSWLQPPSAAFRNVRGGIGDARNRLSSKAVGPLSCSLR